MEDERDAAHMLFVCFFVPTSPLPHCAPSATHKECGAHRPLTVKDNDSIVFARHYNGCNLHMAPHPLLETVSFDARLTTSNDSFLRLIFHVHAFVAPQSSPIVHASPMFRSGAPAQPRREQNATAGQNVCVGFLWSSIVFSLSFFLSFLCCLRPPSWSGRLRG